MKRYGLVAIVVFAGLGLLMGTVLMGFTPVNENMIGDIRMQLTLGVDPDNGQVDAGLDLLGVNGDVDADLGEGEVNVDLGLAGSNSEVDVDLNGENGSNVDVDLLDPEDGTSNNGNGNGNGNGGSGGNGGVGDGFFGLFDTPVPEELMLEEEVQPGTGFLSGLGDFILANWQIILILLVALLILVLVFKRKP